MLSIGIYGMLNIYVFAVLVLFSPVISNVDDMDELSRKKNISNDNKYILYIFISIDE
jgi:thioredoxin-related protein